MADALEPGGRVFFLDDHHRTEEELVEGHDSTVVRRQLLDGRTFRVVKVPYDPATLERRLRDLGWDVAVSATSGPFYWGTGKRVSRAPTDRRQ